MTAFWTADMTSTLAAARRVIAPAPASPHFDAWLSSYDDRAPISSNVGATDLAFQRWMKFKEAFSPKFVIDALGTLERQPKHCIDPFGGSGTTALTCSLLGIQATTIEVNPFLADLIRAKVTPVDIGELIEAYATVLDRADDLTPNPAKCLPEAPASLVEPGLNGRYVFPRNVLVRILALRNAIDEISAEAPRRMLRVLLGSILIEVSNVVVNGKGRRYRGGWETRQRHARDVDEFFDGAVRRAVRDLAEFGGRRRATARVLTGDSRQLIGQAEEADVAIFSPPYPNSFDYTDVYNLELWVLGYLSKALDNRSLRLSTLRSHVQIKWASGGLALNSPTLKATLERLHGVRDRLWNAGLPDMVEAYFQDMAVVLHELSTRLRADGRVIMVVGDSCYAGVLIDVGSILSEVAAEVGFAASDRQTIREMRNSAQHGGRRELAETCIVLTR